MSWWGKLVGGAFGFMLGGPLGALLGTAIGHQFDRGLARNLRLEQFGFAELERVQTAFFTATFSVMGYMAKADGRVSEQEIGFAEAVMAHMALNAEQRQIAIRLFSEGKGETFDLDQVLIQFRTECHRRRSLMRMFLEIQIQAGYADGRLDSAEQAVLGRIAEVLGFSAAELDSIEAMIGAAGRFAGAGGSRAAGGAPNRDTLREAYRVLGVTPEASDAEVKRAYRRLMSQHHPDKLVAKGLPEEMMRLATEKTQEIKLAHETIRAARRRK